VKPPIIGIVAALLAVAAIVGISIYNKTVGAQDVAAVTTAATQAPNSLGQRTQLVDGSSIGQLTFPQGNTATGGSGLPVDGIGCQASEGDALHVHAHLALFQNGKALQVPANIGIVPGRQCLYWEHTHDASGIVHVEAPQAADFTLGSFFDIWGRQLDRKGFAGSTGALTIFVDGERYNGDPRTIPIVAHREITLEAGTPVVTPQSYSFPPGE
jgi:hypothetical protein